MSLFHNYLLYQLSSRYIGPIPSHGDSELLPGSYIYIFDSEKHIDLDILFRDSKQETVECINDYYDAILDFILTIGEGYQLISQEKEFEIEKLEKYFETKYGIQVFSESNQSLEKQPTLYFFPRKILKLKKLLPPDLGQLEQ